MAQTPLLIDISRTLSRAGQGLPTGVDRVERAYIDHALTMPDSRFLAKALGGFALLDVKGMAEFLLHFDGSKAWQRPDLLSQLGRRQSPLQRRVEATLRRLCIAKTPRVSLGRTLRRMIQGGFVYLNSGHSNQASSTLQQIRTGGANRVAVLIHDTIPLDLPQTTRAETPTRFARQLRGVLDQADLLICNSRHTQACLEALMLQWEMSCDCVMAHLGIGPASRRHAPSETPEFVTLGTIEPRKNHILLLDVWEALPEAERPILHIVGRRGWENAVFFERLATSPLLGGSVHEHGQLSDPALTELMIRARALLFPSLAEGFGLPLAEALQLGLPVIASDLPAFREISADLPTYLNPQDQAAWSNAVLHHARSRKSITGFQAPTWDQHFARVFAALE